MENLENNINFKEGNSTYLTIRDIRRHILGIKKLQEKGNLKLDDIIAKVTWNKDLWDKLQSFQEEDDDIVLIDIKGGFVVRKCDNDGEDEVVEEQPDDMELMQRLYKQ